jgi:hypothetical protein
MWEKPRTGLIIYFELTFGTDTRSGGRRGEAVARQGITSVDLVWGHCRRAVPISTVIFTTIQGPIGWTVVVARARA